MNCLKQLVLWLGVVLVVLTAIGVAQTSFTSLQGTITDPSGSAIPGATVVLSNGALKLERTVATGAEGEYRFLALPPGNYTLKVTAKGFVHYEQTGLQLLVNTPATASVQLKVGGASESVTVTSEAPILNLVDASIGNSFDQTQVREIPIEGRNVAELLSLQAGVAYTGSGQGIDKDQDSRNGSVNGARSDQSNITLDGVDVNDQVNGYAFTSVLPTTLDSVQEFRVTTANYNADQGTGSGAQVALITKSGTNNLHGSLYEYHRNTLTSANDFFVKGAEARSGTPNVPDKLIRNIFGVSLGGPIQKDRLFFFANYEGTRRREEESTVRTIPSPSLCAGNITYQDAGGNQVTVTPDQLRQLDPQGMGINLAIENAGHTGYFDKTFCTGQFGTNDPSVGDGFNYSGFRFRAPIKENKSAFIARLDYHLSADGKHTLFWRGNLQNVSSSQAPFLPGSPPEAILSDHSKGFALGYTAVLNARMVNTATWGFTRQSTGIVGNSTQEWNTFYGLDQGIVYSHDAQVPVNNFLDDFAWTKGKHSLQFGGNIGIVRDPRSSLEHSFSVGKGATNWMSPTGFANTASCVSNVCTGGSPLDPVYIGLKEPSSTFAYDYPVLGLLGLVSDIVANYNYDKQLVPLPKGTPVKRNYGMEWYELYGQDSWRMKPNLTVTFGVRWSLFPPPWEVNGFQASPNVNLGQQFDQTVKNMKQGLGYYNVPLLGFVPGGPANNGSGWYNFEKSDFSPRFSFAYSPRPAGGWLKSLLGEGDKTVIRGGFSKVYDRSGMQLLSTFDANPPGGYGATIQNFCCTINYDDAANVPRISDINTIPTCGPVDNCSDPANQLFFQPPPPAMNPPAGLQAITWGVDQSIKTPHAWAIDFSIGRELPKKFSLQLSYVGRLGRNLLTQRDLRQPLNIVDPKSGVDYYSAATALAKVAQAQLAAGGIDPTLVSDAVVDAVGGPPTSAYWHDMLPPLQAGTAYTSFSGFTSTIPGNAGLIQSVYDLYYDPSLSYLGNEVVGIGNLDLYGGLGDNGGSPGFTYSPCLQPGCTGPGGPGGDYLNNQATSTFAWSSIGKSNYNALQASLRKQFSNGLQFDLNYTYSKSIDITSSATRLSWSSSVNVGAPGTRLANAFAPNSRRAVSDFDTTHQINANWMAALPFGKGRRFAGDVSPVVDAFIGGWEFSGVGRWTSGYPFTVDNGNFWATNWDEQGIAQLTAKPKIGHHIDPVTGTVSVFADPVAAFKDFQHPFPGQAGSRNVLRGDGYAGVDMALNKRWKMPFEGHSLQFRWEVFNVANQHRFNALSGLGTQACGCIASLQQAAQTTKNTFGNYTGLLTQPRVMQFALRYEF